MNLTFAVTNFNRYDLLLESFAGVINDPRIDEILIMDDHSEDKYWNKIQELPKFNPKIKVVRQLSNQGMSINKRDAVFNSKNQWVILFDSDNVIGKDYLDALYKEIQPPAVHNYLLPFNIYCPSFAKPHFDYRKFQNMVFDKGELNPSHKPDLSDPMINCLFNTCNYVVNKGTYLNVWEENKEMIATDTLWFNYLWLKSGNAFFVVPGMEYHHRVHKGSGFLQQMEYNMAQADKVKKLIIAL